jgi:hypothetical protein
MDNVDEFHKHELLDRIHCAMAAFADLVCQHQAAPLMSDELEEVIDAMGRAYQKAGDIRWFGRSTSAPQAEPCRDPRMEQFACQNRHQCWEPCGELGHSAEHAKAAGSPVSAPAVSELPPLPDDEAVEQIIYQSTARFLPVSVYEPIRKMMRAYAQAAIAAAQPVIDKSMLKRLAAQHGYRLVEDAPAQDGETAKLNDWEENAQYLLDSYSKSVRSRYKFGPENLLESMCITFIAMRDQLSTARAEGRREGIEEAANVCDRHARASWNDDRCTQAKLDTKEIRNLLNKENSDD